VADKVRRTSTKLAECPLKAVARVRIPSGLLHVTAFTRRNAPSLLSVVIASVFSTRVRDA
jgi:hypothetical protein